MVRLLILLSAALLAAGFVSTAPQGGRDPGQPVAGLAQQSGHDHGQETGDAPSLVDGGDDVPEAAASGRYSAGDLLASLGIDEGLLTVFSALYLLLAGVVLWWILSRGWTEDQNRHVGRHMLQLQRLTFLAVAVNLLRAVWLNGEMDEWSSVFALADDPGGLAWLVLLALSAFGLFLLQRNRFLDTLWLLAGVAAATQIGHADLSFDHVLSSVFSGIHMLAAALWIGGLYVLMLFRRRYRHDTERLAPHVANASIAAMVLLFVSGLANSALYLPDLSLIGKTRWGVILAGKTMLFGLLALVVIGARRRMANRAVAFLRLQFLTLLVVAGVSGIMPISEPVPAAEPLNWHVMGEDVHMTGEIIPLRVGGNEYRVTVWFPEGTGEPRSVEMVLHPEDGKSPARTVELGRIEEKTDLVFAGFADYHYGASGGEIDRPGRWNVIVRITDAAGKVWEFGRSATVY